MSDKKQSKGAFYLQIIKDGIIFKNPTFIQLLGMCPTLAVTTSVSNGIGMGLSATFVLIFSNFFISLLRKFIPSKIRIASYIVIIAGFVTIVDLIMKAYMESLSESLGLFIPLIVVNCIILGRAEMFASKNTVSASALDGLGMGVGFTLALCAIATVREVLGAASFAGFAIPFLADYKIEFLVKAPGGMVVYGLMIALVYAVTNGKAPKKKSFSCAGCPNAAMCDSGSCSGAGEATEAKEEN